MTIIIKNKVELTRKAFSTNPTTRSKLLDIAEFAMNSVSPEKLLAGKIRRDALEKYDHILIVAIGKAARGMAKTCEETIGKKLYKTLIADEGHPLPTSASIRNAKAIVRASQKLTKNDLAIVLISGGGSSMFELPADGISVTQIADLNRELIRSGATIDEINVVRKHLSQVKGGRLAQLLSPATVRGFVISDVVGNNLSTIASGPLSLDSSTNKEAIKILQKYRIEVPLNINEHLKNPESETPKKIELFAHVNIDIIGDHMSVAKAALVRAKELNIPAKILEKPLQGEARDAAEKFLKNCRSGLTIAWGETTVTCRGKGYGGRNQEFVLAALQKLKPNQTILSIGTDGVDGIAPREVAGAIADDQIIQTAQKKKLHIEEYLQNNDSYGFFKKAGGHITTGPTGTNLGDLVLCFSEK